MKNFLTRNRYFVLSILFIGMISCHKQADVNLQNKQDETRFPQTLKEKQTVAVNKEVGTILQEVYQDPKAFYEVCATIYSGYYEDESVLLKDLLFPETSPLYQSPKFKSLRSEKGLFKKEFYATLNKGDYPNLKKAMGLDGLPATGNLRIEAAVPTDTSMEIFSNSTGVSIYFPYSEEFFEPLTTDYFDNINTDPFGYLATVIPADREADSAPGQKPVRRKRIVYDEIEWYIDYFPVTVNDDYAERNTTHIVGVGAEPARAMPYDPPPATNVNRVFVGWAKINNQKQYDHLISFNSENGGGSDIKLCRISGYLQFQNQQVTNFAGDIGDVKFKRKEIRKGYWKRIYWVWDADWVVGNTEQVMAV